MGTRLGSICEMDALPSTLIGSAKELLDNIRPSSDLPPALCDNLGDAKTEPRLSRRFWFEAAIHGDPNAQVALAEDLMIEATSYQDSEVDNSKKRLLAGVLFAMAAQQGNE